MTRSLTYKPFGPRAILIEWPSVIDRSFITEMKNTRIAIFENQEINRFSAILEIVTGFSSLCVYFINEIDTVEIIEKLKAVISNQEGSSIKKNKRNNWEIPVCYEPSFATDIEEVATRCNLTVDEVIALHSAPTYDVHFIGFMPGFPYLGGMDERLTCPRKSVPRLKIPAGSVGIGGAQTGIYPSASPGGWQLIGNCPIPIFDINKGQPALFQAGDQLKFYAINRSEYDQLHINRSELNLENFLKND